MISKLNPKTNPNLRLVKNKYHYSNFATILDKAVEKNFGVGAFNIRNKYILDAVLWAAFEEKSPVIIEIAESEMKYCNLPPEKISDMLIERVEKMIDRYGYMIPIVLHADHMQKDLSLVDRAIKAGFSSVACDQSKNTLEENIKKTKEVVEKCHPFGLSVEGEIGEIGAAEALEDKNLQENLEKYVPKVEEAVKFIKETDIDAFAGFFGNGHGKYMSMPRITWNRIEEIVAKLKEENHLIPLVLHGGSYLETAEYDKIQVFVKAISTGCYKFNYATTLSDIFRSYLPKGLDQKMEEEAKKQDTEWRKVLGQFEKDIDNIDKNRLKNARIEMTYHIRMMMRYAWLSSDKAKLYPEDSYSV